MTESSSFVQPAIPKFDGHYDHWSMLMENFLRSKEYWSLVENGVPAAAEGETLTDVQKKSIDNQKLKDLKAKNFLFQALDRSVLETILKKDTAKDIWDSMKQKYQGTTRVKRAQLQALRKEFEVLQMKNGETKEVNFAEGQEELLLMAYTTTGIANNEDTWFLDSGCSNHMCGKKEYFFDFDANFRDSVKLGNNSSLLVKGKGNIRQLTAAYSPQQNGVAERKNRTIMNMVRSMLSGKDIPKNFTNFCDVNESKAYRLYDPTSNKIIASRDVVFEEDKSWEWNKKNEEIVVRDLEWGVDEEELNDNTEADPIFSTAEGSESDPNDADLLSDSDQVRARVPPVWMRDYETEIYRGFSASARDGRGFDTMKEILSAEAKIELALWKRWVVAQAFTTSSGLLSYPLDTIRRRMMMQAGLEQPMYRGTLDCWRKIHRTEGWPHFIVGHCQVVILLVASENKKTRV
ncbi:hypothetical protein GH714_030057 [Hevea brasiliensis]|uniref:Retrovirus-related Pol polyprotein from transposon TNT 1-94 n=1 Tax=Hevea brasiliensis TaxID=3981 RepID=A0A6A6LTI4_HEVBR|nr:hypothetical protein GH714_030057 [Hevea brasiliensis]